MNASSGRPLRLLTLLEANSITSTCKAFIEFCGVARPAIDPCVVSFKRRGRSLPDEETRAPLEHRLRAIGARHEPIPERFRFDAGVIAYLRDAVERFRPDIIESHSVKSHAVVWSSGLWRRLPWLAYHHGYTTTDAKMRLLNLADVLTLRSADRVITVAEAFAPVLLRRGVRPERLRVVHNALGAASSLNRWDKRAARQALSLRDSTAVVLSVGRLSREKGVADLVRAFAALVSRRSRDVTLVIAGDGPEKARLERLARTLDIAERMRFAGHVLDTSPYYAAADVFAIASHSEGSPYTLLEALAAGVPVAATRVGGIPEMVSDRVNALLVPARDRVAMAGAIECLLSDAGLAKHIAANGRKHVAERFEPQFRAERLLQLFSEVLEERNTQMESVR